MEKRKSPSFRLFCEESGNYYYYCYFYCYYCYYYDYDYDNHYHCLIFRYSNEMAEKSCIIGLPVVPYNQNKISDVCQYLQWLQDLLYNVFKNEVTFTARV